MDKRVNAARSTSTTPFSSVQHLEYYWIRLPGVYSFNLFLWGLWQCSRGYWVLWMPAVSPWSINSPFDSLPTTIQLMLELMFGFPSFDMMTLMRVPIRFLFANEGNWSGDSVSSWQARTRIYMLGATVSVSYLCPSELIRFLAPFGVSCMQKFSATPLEVVPLG